MAIDQQGSRGSLWIKGGFRLGLLVVALVGIYLGVPKARPYVIGTLWFLVISFAIGLVFAGILHLWNEYRPVKTPEDEQIRLGLMDDEPAERMERKQRSDR